MKSIGEQLPKIGSRIVDNRGIVWTFKAVRQNVCTLKSERERRMRFMRAVRLQKNIMFGYYTVVKSTDSSISHERKVV